SDFAGEVGYLIHGTARPGYVSIRTGKVSVAVPVEGLTAAVFDAREWTSPDGLLGTALHKSCGAEWLVVTVGSGRHPEAQLYVSAPPVRSHLAEVLLAMCTAEDAYAGEMDWLRTEDGSL
ncbi:hypothetical protein, partial [Dactylosporangium sp. CA-139066]